MCELHFDNQYKVTEDVFNINDGSICKIPRLQQTLTKDAIPNMDISVPGTLMDTAPDNAITDSVIMNTVHVCYFFNFLNDCLKIYWTMLMPILN